MTRRRTRLICAAALACALFACAPAAHAGTWMEVSCVNPDGSAASSEGWSGGSVGAPPIGSSASTRCAPGTPMSATLSDMGTAPVPAAELLTYAPPAGSTLAGGTVDLVLSADGTGTGGSAVDLLYTPALAYPDDVFYECGVGSRIPCGPDGGDFSGTIALPANTGGDFIATANCGGEANGACSQTPSHDAWARAQVVWAHFLLSNGAVPGASGFSGTALDHTLRGTAHLLFTATDTGGPGVYSVTAAIDGHPVWSGTPNVNGGACAPVGTDAASGALMFDRAQPCPATEVVSIPVPTAGLPDGSHELAVSVTDAAGNSSPVLDRTITTSNPQATPAPKGRGRVRTQFVVSWRWRGSRTLLRSISVRRLPGRARIAVRCIGPRCPRLTLRQVVAARRARLLQELTGRRFTAGDRLLLTVSAPHLRAERIEVRIRDNQVPLARLLGH